MTAEAFTPASLRSRFREVFGPADGLRIAIAPGRVNLIGEHTDYNEGWVLPMAIDRHVGVAFSPRSDRTIRMHSVLFGESCDVDLDEIGARRGSAWSSYIAGVAWVLAQAGRELAGLELLVDGNLPLGSGLSSSAALEMATARALCHVSGIPWRPREMALVGQKVENDFVGVSCGVMDQLASACAEEGCALLLDCRSFETEAVAIPSGATVVVMDTGARRTLAGSEYNERRASCEDAARSLEVRSLRDATPEGLEAGRSNMGELSYRRARHVVEESRRPRVLASLLREGRLDEAGRLMNDSHASLRDLYEVSSLELDRMSELGRRHPACFGARLTGAGFGGCAIALVDSEGADDFIADVQVAYREELDLPSELFAVRAVAGAHLLSPEE